MADKTTIEWTDATWNVVNGCTVHSPGCTNCYAMKQAHRFPPRQGLTVKTNGGMVWTGEVRFNEAVLTQPLRWKRPRRIFVCAHGDLFHESVPDEWIDRVFAVMALASQHQFQVLTKRSARMRSYFAGCENRIASLALQYACATGKNLDSPRWHPPLRMEGCQGSSIMDGPRIVGFETWPIPNVWLGVSVEDQQRADERVPDLLATPAAVRWLSCEPLLGPVDLNRIREEFDGGLGVKWESALDGKRFSPWVGDDEDPMIPGFPKLDWIVVGGESGPNARPMHPDWARSLRDQCEAAGVPMLFKQWGEWGPDDPPESRLTPPYRDPVMEGAGPCRVLVEGKWQEYPNGYAVPIELCSGHGEFVYRLGKRRLGRLLDGVEHNGFPQVPHG